MNLNKKAFSLVELMLSLIIISLIAAAFAPVITKKLSSASLTIGGSNISEITNQCNQHKEDRSYSFGTYCTLCAKQACLVCSLTCENGYYLDSKACSCFKCSDKMEGCESCESENKCTSCTTGTNGYILKDNKCEQCTAPNYYSNGTECSGSCVASDGYYCDSSEKIVNCTETWGTSCSTCDKGGCIDCAWGYFKEGTECKYCYDYMYGCDYCTSATNCTICNSTYTVMNPSTKKCEDVTKIEGCKGYGGTSGSSAYCTSCNGEYYLNTSKTCTKCETAITGCQSCVNGQSANNAKCSACLGGYYLDSNGKCTTCSSKFGTNCATCDNSNCLSCNSGYSLTDDTTGTSSCKNNNNSFTCSDSNFMRIGNLCVTRRNMGDSSILSIPYNAGVIQANAGDYCHSYSNKCCWLGGDKIQTAGSCDDVEGGYSGCKRTTCNWYAANAICANFNYAGKSWRLPTTADSSNWGFNSVGLGTNGLQFCEQFAGLTSAQCAVGYGSDYCKGSYSGQCHPNDIWTANTNGTDRAYHDNLQYGYWNSPTANNNKAYAFGVRCVTEMND